MRWLQTEYILKGIFLGLMLYAALYEAETPPTAVVQADGQVNTVPSPAAPAQPNWDNFARFNLAVLGGLVIALVVAAGVKLREGFQVRGKWHLFLLFLLLESSWLVYLGALAGAAVGLVWIHDPAREWNDQLLFPVVGGGAALGVVFCLLRRVPQKLQRLSYCFIMAAAVACGLLFWFGQFGDAGQKHILRFEILFAAQLAAAVVFFYILTFAGREDESEVEIAVVCAGLAVSLGLLAKHFIPAPVHDFIYLVPVALYFAYALRALPWLRVVKHAFRGLSYAQVGSHRRALQSYRRALQFDPQNKRARAGYWDVHRSLDLNQLAGDPQTLALVDLDLCLDRAGGLLLQDKPDAAQLAEAHDSA